MEDVPIYVEIGNIGLSIAAGPVDSAEVVCPD
jgi:hypothetical protein